MLRFGVIGTGRISDWVLKGAAQDSRITVTAVCSRTSEAAKAFIDRNPLAKDAKIYINHLRKAGLPYQEQLSEYYKKYSEYYIIKIYFLE